MSNIADKVELTGPEYDARRAEILKHANTGINDLYLPLIAKKVGYSGEVASNITVKFYQDGDSVTEEFSLGLTFPEPADEIEKAQQQHFTCIWNQLQGK